MSIFRRLIGLLIIIVGILGLVIAGAGAFFANRAIDATVAGLTDTLGTMAPLALFGMKKHLNLIARGQHDADAIAHAVQRTVHSEDLEEGGAAWREKRKPVFKGR